jgi:cytochrome c biogenesis protein CcdA/peroxiredoxin
MFSLTILSFVAGLLTVLAPCVLPLLPIIIGSSVTSNNKSKPYLVTLGLVISITLFTILLKASTLLINIDPVIWKYISGSIVLVFGLIYLFPTIWEKITTKFNLSTKSDGVLKQAGKKEGLLGSLLIGASLGPVFASCSPTYSLIIATVLPVNFVEGLFYIVVYAIGLAVVLLAIALLGQKLIKKLRVFSNPNGIFKKLMGVIFIVVGIAVISGFDKKVETAILDSGYFDITKIEQKLLENKNKNTNNSNIFSKNNSAKLETQGVIAPEIIGINQWINSNGETIKDLKGKVVLVDFWTYSCINCQRTLPYLTKWYDTYKDKGLVVLGIHAPEFSFEQKIENVQKAVTENKINYPVGLDNNFSTWNNYKNQFWPAHYLIDKDGFVRATHFGEGKYEETESQIQELLGQTQMPKTSGGIVAKTASNEFKLTPETYLGLSRRPTINNPAKLTGKWAERSEEIEAIETGATLELDFSAKEVYLVAQGSGNIQVTYNGKTEFISVNDPKLYTIFKSESFVKNGKIGIVVEKGIILNAFTFG